ncbi:MAG: hypothetical protein M1819_004639 [Sarea resinae]|nr:MAG: hypothetical protein M1819_004639 [Sarea resinae]
MEALSLHGLTALNSIWTAGAPADQVLDIFEAYEAQVALQYSDTAVSGDPVLLSAFFASYQLALMLCDELEEARFLTHRSPPTLQDTDETLVNAKNLLRAVYNDEHTLVYSILRRTSWPEPLQPLISRYFDHFRGATLKNISSLYSSISPIDAARYLGFSFSQNDSEAATARGDPSTQQEMIELLVKQGWKWDSAQGLLYPKPVSEARIRPSDHLKAADYANDMSRLVGLVGFLAE